MTTETDIKVYAFFSKLVFEKCGIMYTEKDYYRLDSRFFKLRAKYDCEDNDALFNLFKAKMTVSMEKFLIDVCTNNETYFFRDDNPFLALKDKIYPDFKKSNPGKQYKIWSCACSTGQEPLTILFSLMEGYPNLGVEDIMLEASDISTDALEKAKSGIYNGLDVQRGLPIMLLMKNFESLEDNHWKIKKHIHDLVDFKQFNLLHDYFPVARYDLIYCRNVLIYQNKENREAILKNVMKALKPGGHLIMGAGESLIGSSVSMTQLSLANTLVFKKEDVSKKLVA